MWKIFRGWGWRCQNAESESSADRGEEAVGGESAWPSLGVIREELDHELSVQGERSRSLDGRAGIQLGFSGVLVGLVKAVDHPNLVQIAGQASAAVAGVLAVISFLRLLGEGVIDPLHLRQQYLLTPAEETRLTVLDTRILLFVKIRADFRRKVLLLGVSLGFLGAALVLLVVGTGIAATK